MALGYRYSLRSTCATYSRWNWDQRWSWNPFWPLAWASNVQSVEDKAQQFQPQQSLHLHQLTVQSRGGWAKPLVDQSLRHKNCPCATTRSSSGRNWRRWVRITITRRWIPVAREWSRQWRWLRHPEDDLRRMRVTWGRTRHRRRRRGERTFQLRLNTF